MKKVVIIPNTKKDADLAVSKTVILRLLENDFNVYIEGCFSSFIHDVNYYENFPEDVDLIIVVGGDGTILDASIFAIMSDILFLSECEE